MLDLALSIAELPSCLAWLALSPSQLPVSLLLVVWLFALSTLPAASFLAWLALSPAQLAVFCALSPRVLPVLPVLCLVSSACKAASQ